MKIRGKVLGVSFIMLGLVVAFQAASYYLTRESIRRLEDIREEIIERKLTLEARHLFVHEMLAFSNYCQFPREYYLWQIGYSEKVFKEKLEALELQLKKCGDPDQYSILQDIRRRDDSHNRLVGLFAEMSRREGPEKAASERMKSVEEAEDSVLSRFEDLGKETTSMLITGEPFFSFQKKLSVLFPSVKPVIDARDDILTGVGTWWTGIELDDLGHRKTIAARRYLLTGHEKYISVYKELKSRFDLEVEACLSSRGKEYETYKKALADAREFSEAVSVVFGDAVGAYRSGDRMGARAVMQRAFVSEQMQENLLEDLYIQKMSEFEAAYVALPSIVRYSLYFNRQLMVITIFVSVMFLAVGSLAIKRMLWPVKMLNEAAQKVARGDWGQRVTVRTRDEIGETAASFNKMTEDLEKAEKELFEWNLDLSILYSVSSAISRTMELDKLLSEVLNAITILDVFSVERKGGIFLVEGDNMRLVSHLGHPDAFLELHKDMKVGDCLCGRAALTGEVIISMNSTEDERHEIRPAGMTPHGHIIVPLKAKDKVVGVLYLHTLPGIEINKGTVNVLRSIGDQVGIAIENARLYEETKALSLHDPLTGLANRRLMDILLERKFAGARRLGTPFSVIMSDLDHFKKYNDAYGHPAGDKLLTLVAGIIESEVREIDLVVRYGGEEFFVLLSDTKPPEAYVVAERIRAALESRSGVTMSVGVASYDSSMQAREDIVRKADAALYLAKQNGRNRVEVYRD